MSGKFSILASAVQSSLPRLLPRARIAAASSALGQRSGIFHASNSRIPHPLRSVCPTTRKSQFGSPDHFVRSYGECCERINNVRNHGSCFHVTRRRAVGSRAGGAEAGEMHETSGRSEEGFVGGRYAVLLTGHASDYTQKLYGGYGEMFIKLLGDPHDIWDVFAVVDGQFPPEEELDMYDGFVVTGSRHDAHGSDDWITKLCCLLQTVHEKKLNTLGVCFGHQVLSRALGGKTGKADVGWEIGLRQIQTTTALTSKPYAVGVPPVFRVMEVHRDQVSELPPGGELLGFSERTGIEVFAVGDHALGIQGHPEFTEDVVIDLIDSRFSGGILTEEEAKAARATLKAGQADQEALVQLCKGFLKRRRS